MRHKLLYLLSAAFILLTSAVTVNAQGQFNVGDKVYAGEGGDNSDTEGTVVGGGPDRYNIHFDKFKFTPNSFLVYEVRDLRRRNGANNGPAEGNAPPPQGQNGPAGAEGRFKVGDKVYAGEGGDNSDTEGTVVGGGPDRYDIHFDKFKFTPNAFLVYEVRDLRRRNGANNGPVVVAQPPRAPAPPPAGGPVAKPNGAPINRMGPCTEAIYKQLITERYDSPARPDCTVTINFESFRMSAKTPYEINYTPNFPGHVYEGTPIYTRYTLTRSYADPLASPDNLWYEGSYMGYRNENGQCDCNQLQLKPGSGRQPGI